MTYRLCPGTLGIDSPLRWELAAEQSGGILVTPASDQLAEPPLPARLSLESATEYCYTAVSLSELEKAMDIGHSACGGLGSLKAVGLGSRPGV